MEAYKYYCKKCEVERKLENDSKIFYPKSCPKCNNEILLFVDTGDEFNRYRVLAPKKASDVKIHDSFFDRMSNDHYTVLGVFYTNKKGKSAISLGLEGFGKRIFFKDDIVYCVTGKWSGIED